MFMLVVVASRKDQVVIRAKLDRHAAKLGQTGLVGEIGSYAPHGVDAIAFFDADSTFSQCHYDDESFSYVGGVLSGTEGNRSGEFAAITIGSGIVTASSDLNGSWPMYFGVNGGMAAAGNDLHAVAIALGLTKLNDRAVHEFLTLQYVLGRETTVKGVFRLWPGERIELPANSLDISPDSASIHSAKMTYRRVHRSSDSAKMDNVFQKLVDGLSKEEVEAPGTVVQVSGGLDSRLTAGIISRAGITSPECVTLRLADDEEVRIASQVSNALGFRHRSIELPQMQTSDLRDGWLLTGGQVSTHAAAGNLPIYRMLLRDNKYARIVGAWPGDMLIGSYVPSLAEFTDPKDTKRAVKHWIRSFTSNRAMAQSLRKSRGVKRLQKELPRTLQLQVSEMEGLTAAEKISRWAFMRRASLFTFISPARLCTSVLEITPVLAPDYVRHLLELTGTDIVNKNFYRKLIWSKFPELREIPYHNTGRPITPEYLPPQRMSLIAQILLHLPHQVTDLAVYVQSRMSRTEGTNVVSVEVKHWQKLLSDELPEKIKISDRIVVDFSKFKSPSTRVAAQGVALSCFWTRTYLESYRALLR